MRSKLFFLLLFSSLLSIGATYSLEIWDEMKQWFGKVSRETSESFEKGKESIERFATKEKQIFEEELKARQKLFVEKKEKLKEDEKYLEKVVKAETESARKEIEEKETIMEKRVSPVVESTKKSLGEIKEKIKDPNFVQNVKDEFNHVKDWSFETAENAMGKIKGFYEAQRERNEMSKKWDKESLNAKAASFLDSIEEIIEVSSLRHLPEITTFSVTSNVNVFDRKKLETELEKMSAASDQLVSVELLKSLLKGVKFRIVDHAAKLMAKHYQQVAAAAAADHEGGEGGDDDSLQHGNDDLDLDIDLKDDDDEDKEETTTAGNDQQQTDEELSLENLSGVEEPERILESILNDLINDYDEDLERRVVIKLKMLRRIIL